MIRCLIGIWRVISSLLFRNEVESPPDSETGQGPLPSAITVAEVGEGSDRRPPSSSSSSAFQMLNEHICQLYKPNGQPAMEILFFHGLQFGDSTDAYLSTWTTGDGLQQIWPATWLAEKFPDAHIFSVSYDSRMRMTPDQGRTDLFVVAENLMHALCWANIGQGFRRPVILVGHSFGGLVMKQLCVKAEQTHSNDSEGNKKIGKFLSNVGGLFFYGTPHRGISLPQIAAHFLDSPLLAYVKLLNAEGARLESVFDAVRKKYKIWHIASVGELQETSWGPFRLLVVPEASARYGADFYTVAANHISLCKPAKKTSSSFQTLINFIPKVHVERRCEDFQHLPKLAVGLDFRVEEVQKMLQQRTRVGMFGMGGVGKTTVARAVFNELSPTFEYSCFCADVKLMEARTVEDLKKGIWKHMHCDGKKIVDKQEEWSKLRGKRLLLVLDDVDHDRHVEGLVDIAHVVAAESIFLMTSREKDILKLELDDNELYQVPFLSKNDAIPLFLSHAFPNQAGPTPTLEKHVHAVVMKCEGLPLTLEVLGSCLRGQRDVKVWEQALDALGKAESRLKLNERLWEKLRVSYDRLEEQEQHMFLDATTFFSDRSYRTTFLGDRSYRWRLLEAKAAWSAIYGYECLGWKALVDASLVYDVEENESIKVHEQLLSLGRKIASEDARKGVQRRRIWEGTEGWKSLQLTDESNHQEIHSLRLSKLQSRQFNIPRTSLSRLEKVQYLDVQDEVSIDGAQENERLLFNLVILQSPALHFGRIHFDLALPRLAVLMLTSYDEQSLPDSFGHLPQLKILVISYAPLLETLPQSFGELSSLNNLELCNCINLHSLPESFGKLSALNHLIIKNSNLGSLPESFGALFALSHLEIRWCHQLRSLPESFGGLSALNYLAIVGCSNLRALPKSFGRLSALNYLQIKFCKELQTLPEVFGGLSTLKRLEIVGCKNLEALPEDFGGLSALNHLEISDCINLHSLPESFGELSTLNHLEISKWHKLQTLSEAFGGLSVLNHLEISDCDELQILPEAFGGLSALNHLELSKCHKLQTLPEAFGGLSALNHLEISYCDKLQTLPESFGELSALNHLEISKCHKLQTLPEAFGGLSALNHLQIKLCRQLSSLPESFGGLSALNYLEIYDCCALQTLPESFGTLSALYHLGVGRCCRLSSLPESFGGLSTLNYLEFIECDNLQILPESFGGLSTLEHLKFKHVALNILPVSFGQLEHLKYLELSKCQKLETLPDSLSQLKDLRHLTMRLLPLKSIPESIKGLPSLQILELGFLPYLKSLPPWLGQRFSAPPNHLQKFSRSHEGYFVLEELEEGMRLEFIDGDHEWFNQHNIVMHKVRALDYAGALEAYSTIHIEFVDIESWRSFILQERGILKRLTGNLVGALEDLTAALEINFQHGDDDYERRKHRGYVKYLLGDISGARTDAERALAIWSEGHLEKSTSYRNRDSQIEDQRPGLRDCLGVEPVQFLDFNLI